MRDEEGASDGHRRKFDKFNEACPPCALILFPRTKKYKTAQIHILRLICRFIKALLASDRSTRVWISAKLWKRKFFFNLNASLPLNFFFHSFFSCGPSLLLQTQHIYFLTEQFHHHNNLSLALHSLLPNNVNITNPNSDAVLSSCHVVK